ncbi:hypothetical protein Trydic_g20181 [Trypoxylus dichotomus]
MQVRNYLKLRHLPEKASLSVDNCTGHSGEEFGSEGNQFTIKFSPPNTTPTIHPMKQNPINSKKLAYQKQLLSKILASDEANLTKCFKEFGLEDTVLLLSYAWHKILSESFFLKTNMSWMI